MTQPVRHSASRSSAFSLCLLLLVVAGVPLAAQAPQPPEASLSAGPSEGPNRFSVEVRAADLGEVLAAVSGPAGVTLAAEAAMAGRRLTMRGTRISAAELQAALAQLYQTRWTARRSAALPRGTLFQLEDDDTLQAAGERHRLARHRLLLQRLRSTAGALARTPGATVAQLQGSLARRRPFLPEDALGELAPDSLAGTTLALLMGPQLRRDLELQGAAVAPLSSLEPAARATAAQFYLARLNITDPLTYREIAVDVARIFADPRARLEWRILYCDPWVDSWFIARTGFGDNWAQAALPSSWFDLPDYAALVSPAGSERPAPAAGDPLLRPLKLRVDTHAATWDQALSALAKEAEINVLSESFPRPLTAQPRGLPRELVPPTVQAALDQLSRHYGYVWWRSGPWYLFRHRYWYEEQRVSLPEATLRALGDRLLQAGRVTADVIDYLARLDDGRLLTLDLLAGAYGRSASLDDLPELQRQLGLRQVLAILQGTTEAQLRAAYSDSGLPASQLAPAQRAALLAYGWDRGLVPPTGPPAGWRVLLSSTVYPERVGGGIVVTATFQVHLDFGDQGARRIPVRLRLPASLPPGDARAPEPPGAGGSEPAQPAG